MARPEQFDDDFTDGREFAAHYYAEIGGNKDKPLAKPSDEESRIAAEFLAQTKNEFKGDVYGRLFARHVLSRSQAGKFMPLSLVLAMRLHSDSFVAHQSKSDRRSAPNDANSQQAQLESSYRSFVDSEANRLLNDPELRGTFELDVSSRLESCRKLSERAFEMLRAEVETEAGRRELFKEFIERYHPKRIQSFSKWCDSVSRTDERAPVATLCSAYAPE